MKMSVVVTFFNNLRSTIGFWMALMATARNRLQYELVVVDNGSTDDSLSWVDHYVGPHWARYVSIRNTENIGFQRAINQGVRRSTGEIVACFHNDLFLMEFGWDQRVIEEFDRDPSIGLAGFVGAATLERDGGRSGVFSNMHAGHEHGALHAGTRRVAVFDSLSLIFRRTAFDDVGGMEEVSLNHFSDKDVCCRMASRGWARQYIGVHCFHSGGTTSTSKDYLDTVSGSDGDIAIHKEAERRFLENWSHLLPLRS